MKHTPTPWRTAEGAVSILVDLPDHAPQVTQKITDVNGTLSAKERIANAAFIVRAVNAHDDLVAALRDAIELIETLLPVEMTPAEYAVRGAGYTALKKAGAL
jgi:hypothetical protein